MEKAGLQHLVLWKPSLECTCSAQPSSISRITHYIFVFRSDLLGPIEPSKHTTFYGTKTHLRSFPSLQTKPDPIRTLSTLFKGAEVYLPYLVLWDSRLWLRVQLQLPAELDHILAEHQSKDQGPCIALSHPGAENQAFCPGEDGLDCARLLQTREWGGVLEEQPKGPLSEAVPAATQGAKS